MAVTKTLFYIACLCFARDFVFCDDYEEVGNEIILTPRIRGKPEEILWKHNENKVLEYDGSKVDEYGSFKDRVVVDFETGELTIRKLNSQDSGQYQADIVINGKVQSSSHTLTVLEVLLEPHVSCELDETSDVKKLLCSVESQTLISYEWSGPNINGHSGHELAVDKQKENLDSVYTCTVNNRVNSKSTDFTLKDCHTGREGSVVLVPVLIVTALLLIGLIALAVFLYIVYRRKKQQQARPSEPKDMDPEYGQDQNLLSNATTECVPGSSDAIATLPSHNRLPFQKEPIADKKLYQDNKPGDLGETDELLKETISLLEQSLKQSPQSAVIETNQEDTGKGDGELKYEKNSENAFETEGNTYSKPDETEKERHELLQSQEEEEKEKIQILKQESGETSPEHQNERLKEKKTEDNNEDNQTPGETENTIDRPDTESPQSAVTERNVVNEAEQVHENKKKSQNDDGEQSLEQQNEKIEETEDAANSGNDMRPGDTKERSEEKNNEGIDGPNTVDQPVDGEAPSAPAVIDSPANMEKDSSVAASSQSDLYNHTSRDKEKERKRSGLDQDEKGKVVTNQEEKGGQEQMPEAKNHDPEILPDMTDKDQSLTLIDNNAKVMQNERETEVQIETQHGGHLTEEDGGDGGHRDKSNDPEQGIKEKNDPPEISQK
ncbi:protein starmaker-like isoform X1 [Chanodichthys erythropterus]|uniref:protein starmaker-like isoform X1 n=1 Tax=Chanodichthys erythropterus TaxID=933992 RepID=UPI00351F2B8E